MAPFIARGARPRTRSDGRKDIATLVSNGHKAAERMPPTVTRRGSDVFLQMTTPRFKQNIKTKIKNVNYFHFTQWPSGFFRIVGTANNHRRTFEGWRLERAASLVRELGSQLLQGAAVTPKGYCWRRPVAKDARLREMKQSGVVKRSPKTKGTCPKAQRRRGEEHRRVPPKGGKELSISAKRRAAKRSQEPLPKDQRRLLSQRGAERGGSTVRRLYGVSSPAVNPLHSVGSINITRIPPKYS